MTYQFKTTPFPHQLAIFEQTRDKVGHGLWLEMGCGKTKIVVDNAAYLYQRGEVNAILAVCPDNVVENWPHIEVPAHLPDGVPWTGLAWHADAAKTKRQRDGELRALAAPGLAVVAMSYAAVSRSKAGRDFAREFLKRRRCLLVADESHRIKTPGAEVTKLVHAAGRLAPYRRALSGTPVPNSAFDVYSQVQFLDRDYWQREAGIRTYTEFKSEFGVFVRCNGAAGRFDKLVRHKNLDKLYALMAPIGHRLTKEEAGLDLPPKVYSRRTFELSVDHRAVYDRLRDEFLAELDGGVVIDAPLAFVRLLRLQQVACGYSGAVDADGERVEVELPGEPARLAAFRDFARDVPHQAIVWARFTRDIDRIVAMLRREKITCARYDGGCSGEERRAALAAFHAGDAQWVVANQAAMSTGVTLTEAKTVAYYSNSFNLSDRLQSEDRCHRIGQMSSVQYVDFVAERTVDGRLLECLRNKSEVAAQVVGDRIREWL